MKKLYVLFAFVLWGITQIAEAQNVYRNYLSVYGVPKPKSAVSVVHNSGYVYFFQADASGNLSATEIDPLSMLPTGNNMFYHLSIPDVSNFEFYLNGGFEDANGNFVLFGYYHRYITTYSYYICPAYFTITSNLTNCNPYYYTTSGVFTDGCAGYDVNGTEVYVFVNNGELAAINLGNPSLSKRITLITGQIYPDQYTDISWDDINGHFIASGSAWNSPTGHEDPFVAVFDLLASFAINPVAEFFICLPPCEKGSEYKSLHTQLDGNNLILYHDLRRENNPDVYDIIWLTRINNFLNVPTAGIVESVLYELPNAKIFATDMLYDRYNNRLNFLGYFNYCKKGLTHLLAQVNPYSLSSGIKIGQLGATFMGDTCLNLQDSFTIFFNNDLKMINLVSNKYNPCSPVLLAGVDNQQSILTETYDISLSTCDKPLLTVDKPVLPILKPYNIDSLPYDYPPFLGNSTTYQDNVIINYLCDETNICSHRFGVKSAQQSLIGNKTRAQIIIETNRVFVCEGFEGDIQYSLYDITGKMLLQGTTKNGKRIMVKESNGIYLLQATDFTGNQVMKKIILF